MLIDLIKVGTDTSETLNKMRSETDSESWEQLTNENAIRRMLGKTKEMTEELIDANILAIVQVKTKNKDDKVVNMPILGKDGSIHCVICNNFPVTCPIIIPEATNKVSMRDDSNNDVNFISFVCNNHTANLELTQKEIEDNNVWFRLFELGNRYLKEESEL